jgi:LysM repeat protein
MGLFGKSFKEKVDEAVAAISQMGIGVRDLRAEIEGKVVTLYGKADDIDAKKRAFAELNARVDSDNALNKISIEAPHLAEKSAPEPARERIHEVVAGDTLGAIAKTYYGKASLYMKIFEANRDILDNPDLIKVGQKLRIPD